MLMLTQSLNGDMNVGVAYAGFQVIDASKREISLWKDNMIDTHLHILPGVDDGPETIQESLTLAQALVQEGIQYAIATPHYNDEFPQRSAAEIRQRVYHLQQELDRNGIPLRLFSGHEAL